MMMMGAEWGVSWPLCHVPCCTCSTSWCYQGPLVSLTLDGKLPESIDWGQGGGCAAAGTQFLRSGCRRPNCSPLACEIACFFFLTWSVWGYTDLICSKDHILRILRAFKSTAQSLFPFFFPTKHETSESHVSEHCRGGELIVLCITFLNF